MHAILYDRLLLLTKVEIVSGVKEKAFLERPFPGCQSG